MQLTAMTIEHVEHPTGMNSTQHREDQRWTHWGARLLSMLFTLLSLGSDVWAADTPQNYPNRPVKMILPYAAGGYTDQISRILGDSFARTLGQPFVLESKAGGGGRIGAEYITKVAPDGYELLMTTNGTHTYMAVTEKNLSYDPIKDFTPISLIGTYGL